MATIPYEPTYEALSPATQLALHEQRLSQHDKAIDVLASETRKAIWMLVTFAFTVAATGVGVVLGT